MKRIVNYFPCPNAFTVAAAVFLSMIALVPLNPVFAASGDSGQVATTAKADKGDHIEARIKKLHTLLKITPAQEDLWNNVTQVMRENHKTMEELTKARDKNAKSMTAVEDFKSYSEITDAHAAGLKKFIPAFEALYATMSDEQKKNADVSFRSQHSKKKLKRK